MANIARARHAAQPAATEDTSPKKRATVARVARPRGGVEGATHEKPAIALCVRPRNLGSSPALKEMGVSQPTQMVGERVQLPKRSHASPLEEEWIKSKRVNPKKNSAGLGMNSAAVLRRRSGERKEIRRAHRQQGGGLCGFTHQVAAADQTRSWLGTWRGLLFLKLYRAPLDEVRNLSDHFFIGPGAGDFEAAMPALRQIDTETARPFGRVPFCGNPQSRVCGFHRSHICGFPSSAIRGWRSGPASLVLLPAVAGSHGFPHLGAGTRILTGAAALKGGNVLSR